MKSRRKKACFDTRVQNYSLRLCDSILRPFVQAKLGCQLSEAPSPTPKALGPEASFRMTEDARQAPVPRSVSTKRAGAAGASKDLLLSFSLSALATVFACGGCLATGLS